MLEDRDLIDYKLMRSEVKIHAKHIFVLIGTAGKVFKQSMGRLHMAANSKIDLYVLSTLFSQLI